jgi:hypothetical protein
MSVVVDNMEASEMQEDSIARHKPKRGIAEKLINFTEDEEQQYEEQSDPEETFVWSILLGFLLHQIQIEMLICHQTLG